MNDQNNNLSSALARAQATMPSAQKTGYNPHFRSNFSTLEDLVSASRESLTREGLSIVQFRDFEGENDFLVTQLRHASGDVVAGRALLYLKDKTEIQKLGSAISYLKRYEYASICGMSTSDLDDDGNSNSPENTSTESPQRMSHFASEKQVGFIKTLLKGNVSLEAEICVEYDIDSITKLPSHAASEVIKKLQGK